MTPETIDTYRAELEATGKVEREGVTLTYDAARLNDNRKWAPWVLDYGDSRTVFPWQDQRNVLSRFAGEVRDRINRRLAPIREAEALAARIAAPVDLARVIDLLESAAIWIENEPDPDTGKISSLAQELTAAAAALRAKGELSA